METIIIKIDDKNIINQLNQLQIEVNGRVNILAYMINNGMRDSQNFQNYQQEYFTIFNIYNNKKQELQRLFINPILEAQNINPETASWNLNFETEEVTLTYEI